MKHFNLVLVPVQSFSRDVLSDKIFEAQQHLNYNRNFNKII